MRNKLTSWEWKALTSDCNLADGHAHQEQNAKQLSIINELPAFYLNSEKESQDKLQERFAKNFFTLAGQLSYKKFPDPLYHYACSIAIETVANYLRLTNKSVAMIHPTFDNLADILKRHKVPLLPIEEEEIKSICKGTYDSSKVDALFLVCPNNPTGLELTQKEFMQIVNYCKNNNKLLILDLSFRFYSNYVKWDQYEILYKSGVDFVCLEDTGKTWPTLDMKLGIIVSSNSIYESLKDITNDFILNVSPFIFQLINKYLEVEKNERVSVIEIIMKNRKILKEAIINSPLKIVNQNSILSVEWIQLPPGWKATNFCKWLEKNKIFVLPGLPFYWNDNSRGESYIRIALARPEGFFKLAIEKLSTLATEYKKNCDDNN
ncbi:MAG TPA: pyridoxal phosphate-dependent aminotransferase [Candidatus Woesebacteria bacterium]|mgnify:CR=1 FL=1|nr:pyridoxal phosphate-dependent aminotransferase [Candidatus Woesebacteria bacterium]